MIRLNLIRNISLIKTVYFNYKYLPIKEAVKLPILVSTNVLLKKVKGSLEIKAPLSFGMIKVGFGDVGIFDMKRSKSIWEASGKIIFKGQANIGHGSKISIGKEGVLTIGEKFNITSESSIVVHHKVNFGKNCLISWDALIMDTDFHVIKNEFNQIINAPAPIVIGDFVWIGCRSLILKGTVIPNRCVIGADSLVSKKLHYENSLYAGNPISKLKENISWEV